MNPETRLRGVRLDEVFSKLKRNVRLQSAQSPQTASGRAFYYSPSTPVPISFWWLVYVHAAFTTCTVVIVCVCIVYSVSQRLVFRSSMAWTKIENVEARILHQYEYTIVGSVSCNRILKSHFHRNWTVSIRTKPLISNNNPPPSWKTDNFIRQNNKARRFNRFLSCIRITWAVRLKNWSFTSWSNDD